MLSHFILTLCFLNYLSCVFSALACSLTYCLTVFPYSFSHLILSLVFPHLFSHLILRNYKRVTDEALWQKLASLAQELCTLWFQFFGAVFASKGYPFKNIFPLCFLILFSHLIFSIKFPLYSLTSISPLCFLT